jgi:hypothetical protein
MTPESNVSNPPVTVLLIIVWSNVGRPPEGDGGLIGDTNQAEIEIVSGAQETLWSTTRKDRQSLDWVSLQERVEVFFETKLEPQIIHVVFRPEVTSGELFPVLGLLTDMGDRTGRPLVVRTERMIVDGFIEP